METLQAAGVPAGVVQSAQDVLENDPHLKARGYYVYLDHAEAGRTAYDGPGFRLSKTPGRLLSPAPMLGEHTALVCTRRAGHGRRGDGPAGHGKRAVLRKGDPHGHG